MDGAAVGGGVGPRWATDAEGAPQNNDGECVSLQEVQDGIAEKKPRIHWRGSCRQPIRIGHGEREAATKEGFRLPLMQLLPSSLKIAKSHSERSRAETPAQLTGETSGSGM